MVKKELTSDFVESSDHVCNVDVDVDGGKFCAAVFACGAGGAPTRVGFEEEKRRVLLFASRFEAGTVFFQRHVSTFDAVGLLVAIDAVVNFALRDILRFLI
jgi:hypothetical protein